MGFWYGLLSYGLNTNMSVAIVCMCKTYTEPENATLKIHNASEEFGTESNIDSCTAVEAEEGASVWYSLLECYCEL